MRRHEWYTAGWVALVVTAVTAVCMPPVVGWAGDGSPIAVPALPPTTLTIPTIQAQVTAAAEPKPGQGVMVSLQVTAPRTQAGAKVPVTVVVLGTTSNPMARMIPAPEEVAQASTTVTLGLDGRGTAPVFLLLVWAQPAPPPSKEEKEQAMLRTVTTYQMVLRSSLGGESAPAGLRLPFNIKPTETPQASPAPAQLSQRPQAMRLASLADFALPAWLGFDRIAPSAWAQSPAARNTL